LCQTGTPIDFIAFHAKGSPQFVGGHVRMGAAVELALSGLPVRAGAVRLQHYRIDHDHSNAFTAWQQMGSPKRPTSEQYGQLEKVGRLALLGEMEALRVEDAKVTLRLQLPRQAVSLVVLEWGKKGP
jgi:xylan 1,4-beta-xylosidase